MRHEFAVKARQHLHRTIDAVLGLEENPNGLLELAIEWLLFEGEDAVADWWTSSGSRRRIKDEDIDRQDELKELCMMLDSSQLFRQVLERISSQRYIDNAISEEATSDTLKEIDRARNALSTIKAALKKNGIVE